MTSAALVLALTAAPQISDSVVAIRSVTVVDVKSGQRRPGVTVVIQGARIHRVGPAAATPIPAGARIVDGAGRFLIPGLWDMHVHLGTAGDSSLPYFVASGVTGVRDMGSERLEPLREWRTEILAGRRLGPRIVAAGPIVDGPTPNWPLRVTIRDAAEGRRAVDSLATAGADFIKVHQQLQRDGYFGIAAEARRLGIPFAGHVPTVVSGREAAEAGQRSFEHLTGIPAPGDTTFAGTIAALRRHGTWVDPTLSVYWVLAHREDSAVVNDRRIATITGSLRKFWDDQKIGWSGDMNPKAMEVVYRGMLSRVTALRRAGVPLLTATDLGFVYLYPGSSLLDELDHLTEAGLTPIEALRAATLEPARYLQREHELGSVEAGKLADLVLLDADPLRSIRNVRSIRAVFVNGRVFDRAELDRLER